MAKAKIKTEREIVDGCNELARLFYSMQGYQVPDDYRFYEAHHPHEVGCWNMAVAAYEHIEGTPVEDALSNLEDE